MSHLKEGTETYLLYKIQHKQKANGNWVFTNLGGFSHIAKESYYEGAIKYGEEGILHLSDAVKILTSIRAQNPDSEFRLVRVFVSRDILPVDLFVLSFNALTE